MTIKAWIDNDWKNRYLIESFEDAERWFEIYTIDLYKNLHAAAHLKKYC